MTKKEMEGLPQQSGPQKHEVDAVLPVDLEGGEEEESASGTNNNEIKQKESTQLLEEAMESVVRITLAGLGGSMIGLSQERRLESMRVVSGAAAAAAARRKRAPSSTPLSNLPVMWAVSCMSFCVLLETCRNVSPTSWVLNQLLLLGDDEEVEQQQQTQEQQRLGHWPYATVPGLSEESTISTIRTVGDFTLGGAIAGVVGSFGRNTHLRQRLPSALFKGPQRFFGLVPGITLGFAAGLLQASIDIGERHLLLLQTTTNQSGPESCSDQPKEDTKP